MRAAFAVLLLLGACHRPSASHSSSPIETDPGPEVQAALVQLSGCFHADQKRDALARLQTPEFALKVLAVLGDPAGPCFAAAAELAARLELEAAAEILLAVARDTGSTQRAVALATSNRIRQVPTEQLAAFLLDCDPDLECAVLTAMAGRNDVPYDAVVTRLSREDLAVARAAAAALPTELTPRQAAEVAGVIFANQDTALAVVGELAGRAMPADVFVGLLARLPREQVPVQEAILTAVAARPDLPVHEPLRDLVRQSASAVVRFEALRCLLAAGAVDADWLLARSVEVPRPHRILCAIGLLRLDRKEGARLLCDLAFPGGAGDEVDAVTLAARQVLSAAANLALHRGEAEFLAWSEQPVVVRPGALEFRVPAAQLCAAPD